MIHRLKAYLPFTRGFLQSQMAYDWNFWIYMLGSLIRVFITFFLWQAIFNSSSTPTLGGFSFLEMAVYVFMTELTLNSVFNDADWIVSDEVKTGSISINLIRPISYHLRILFMILGQFIFQFLLIGLPVWAIFSTLGYFAFGIMPPALLNIGLYIVSTFLAFLTVLFFNLSFGFMAFYLTNLWGLSVVKHTLFSFFSGAVIPLAFFPGWAQSIMAFLPFGSMASTPILIYLGKLSGGALVWALGSQVFWLAVFIAGSMLIYRGAISKLTINGG